MNNFPRYTLNRTIAMLAPKQPFLEWVNDTDPEEPAMTLADLCEDNEAFLIPQFSDLGESIRWVEKRWSMLFEHMLAEWMLDETAWPENRTLDMFREWFDIEIHTLVWDLSGEPLMVEDWHDEDDEDEDEAFEVREKINLH